MTTLPEAGIGEESTAPRGMGALWLRARALAGERLSYALADQVVYSFGNMVVAALLSRYGGRDGRAFGTYILTQRAMDILIQLCSVFFWSPFTFNLPGTERERQKSYLGSIVAQQVVACGLSAVILWAAGVWARTPGRAQYHDVFAPLALTSIGILFREFTRRMYFAEMRFQVAFWTEAATVAMQIAGVGWLCVTHRLDVPGTLWMLSGGAMLVNVYWLLTEWNTFRIGLSETVDDLKRNMKLGRWLLGGNMVFMVSSQCNPWILSGVLGVASVGAYTVCESVVNIPRVALNSLQNAMAPMMARSLAAGGKGALRKMVGRFDRMLFLGSAVFAVLIVTAGPWVAGLIFKRPADHLTLIFLAINFVAFAATLAQSYGLTAIDRADLPLYANVVGLGIQIVLAAWLVHAMKVPGPALAMLLGSVVVLVVRQMFYRREMREA